MDAVVSQGLRWSVQIAQVTDVREWQNKETGEPQARVILSYWGGRQELPVGGEDVGKFLKFKGKFVKGYGGLVVTENKWGAQVRLTLEQLEEVKA